MFFPLTFWIKVGDLACGPSRSRHKRNPLPILSVDETASLIGPYLVRPFESRPDALNAYQSASDIANHLDSKLLGSEELSKLTHRLFQKEPRVAAQAAAKQWEGYREPAAGIRKLLEIIDWQLPVNIEKGFEGKELSKLKQINFATQLQAVYQWSRGEEALALAELQSAYQFSDRLQSCDGLFIHELVATSCFNRFCRMLRAGVAMDHASDRFLVEIQRLLGTEVDPQTRMEDLFEREFWLSVIPNARLRGTPWEPQEDRNLSSPTHQAANIQQLLVEWTFRNHPHPLDRKQTIVEAVEGLEAVSELFDSGWAAVDCLNALADSYAQGIPENYKVMLFDPIRGISLASVTAASTAFNRLDNAFGRLSLYRLFSIGAQIVAAAYKREAELSATRICVAAARLRLIDKNLRLDSLATLVQAGVLERIPCDVVTETPFRFDPETQSVWLPGPKNMTFVEADANRNKGAWIWKIR